MWYHMGPEERAKTLILWSAYGLGIIIFCKRWSFYKMCTSTLIWKWKMWEVLTWLYCRVLHKQYSRPKKLRRRCHYNKKTRSQKLIVHNNDTDKINHTDFLVLTLKVTLNLNNQSILIVPNFAMQLDHCDNKSKILKPSIWIVCSWLEYDQTRISIQWGESNRFCCERASS